MDLNEFTQAELHNALSILFLGINVSAGQVYTILAETEKFDAELSLQVIEGLRKSLTAANDLLIDSYKRQGLTDETIEARLDAIRKKFDL